MSEVSHARVQGVEAARGQTPDPSPAEESLHRTSPMPMPGLAYPAEPEPLRRRPHPSGDLPEQLQAKIESLTGAPMDGVRVQRGSPRPAQLDALAYARGDDIYLAPGQEAHLAHEAWHVAQQRTGRVGTDRYLGGMPLNEDAVLEAEADRMSALAVLTEAGERVAHRPTVRTAGAAVVQRVIPGLEDMQQLNQIPNDWVELYIAEIVNDQTHLYVTDIEKFLNKASPGWEKECILKNTDGNHWDVELRVGTKQALVRTVADGNCGPHAVHVVMERANIVAAPEKYLSSSKGFEAPRNVIAEVRSFAQSALKTEEHEIRSRILTEIHDADFSFMTGFGPLLQAAIEKRAEIMIQKKASGKGGGLALPESRSDAKATGATTKADEKGPQKKGEEEVAALAEIDVWTLLALPESEIRKVLSRYGRQDRRGLASALSEKITQNFQAWMRLPTPALGLTLEALTLLTPKALHAFSRQVKEEIKKLPEAPKELVEFVRQNDVTVKQVGPACEELQQFAAIHKYTFPKQIVLYEHELFDHDVVTLYPLERKKDAENEWETAWKKPAKEADEKESLRKFSHRPILDLEFVGGRFYARCYLGLFAPGASGQHKDITADPTGKIKFQNIGLMNLGNPFKALLWCEDYLSSKEHDEYKPNPVVRSFLIPLPNAAWLLGEGGRPLDQDRGSGQFGNYGTTYDVDQFNPLIGSLVSFFLDVKELERQEKGQEKLPMPLLQEYLTGTAGDPREMTTRGVAAQHGRKGHTATFGDKYEDALDAYYKSLEGTGFTDATQKGGELKTGKWKKDRIEWANVELERYPRVMAAFKSIRKKGPTVKWT